MKVTWNPLTNNIEFKPESYEDKMVLKLMVGVPGQIFRVSHVDEGSVDESSPSEVREVRMARNPVPSS